MKIRYTIKPNKKRKTCTQILQCTYFLETQIVTRMEGVLGSADDDSIVQRKTCDAERGFDGIC